MKMERRHKKAREKECVRIGGYNDMPVPVRNTLLDSNLEAWGAAFNLKDRGETG